MCAGLVCVHTHCRLHRHNRGPCQHTLRVIAHPSCDSGAAQGQPIRQALEQAPGSNQPASVRLIDRSLCLALLGPGEEGTVRDDTHLGI